MKKIAVIMGSASDLPIVEKAFPILRDLQIPYDAHIYSAHRTADSVLSFARKARENGYGAIIACAGMAAHLAGFIAANTTLPVIGVPLSASLGGMDALLSTVQMPSGVPVATVAVDGSKNAAWLAAEILAVHDTNLSALLHQQRQRMTAQVQKKNEAFEQGFRA